MNSALVVTEHTVTIANFAPKKLFVGDKIAPSSPFYWPSLWSGNSVDSGTQDSDASASAPFLPDTVVISETNPQLDERGVWIQPLPNGNWTMWIEVEKNGS